MYTSKSIVILITALSAGALPPLGTATPIISLRDFPNGNPECIGRVSGHVDDQCSGDLMPGVAAPDGTSVLPTAAFNSSQDICITFNTPAHHVNVDWGCFNEILSYSDAHCGSTVVGRIHGYNVNKPGKVQTCFEKERLGDMGSFRFEGLTVPGGVVTQDPAYFGEDHPTLGSGIA